MNPWLVVWTMKNLPTHQPDPNCWILQITTEILEVDRTRGNLQRGLVAVQLRVQFTFLRAQPQRFKEIF